MYIFSLRRTNHSNIKIKTHLTLTFFQVNFPCLCIFSEELAMLLVLNEDPELLVCSELLSREEFEFC